MNPRGFFQLLRLRMAVLCSFLAVSFLLPAVLIGPRDSKDSNLLFFLIIVAPVITLGVLTDAAQEAFHTTFSAVLPGLRCTIRRWFVLSSLGLSLIWAALVHFLRRDFPWFAAWMLVWMMTCGVLPLERPGWKRNWTARLVLIIVLLFIFFQRQPFFAWSAAHRYWIGMAAGAVALVSISLGFDKSRLRRRSLTPRRSPFGDKSIEQSLERSWKRFQRPWRKRTAQWRRETWLGTTPWAWVSAAWFENNGTKLLLAVVVLPLLVLFITVFGQRGPAGVAGIIFYSLVDPASGKGTVAPPVELLVVVSALVLGVTASVGFCQDRVYPLSRRDRAVVCFRSLLIFDAGLVLGWGLVPLTIVWVDRMLSPSLPALPLIPWFMCKLGLVLTVLPFCAWARFIPRRLGCFGALLTAFVLMPALIGVLGLFFAARTFGVPSSAVGLVTCLGLPFALHLLVWHLLRRDYSRRDLITAAP